MRGTITKWVIDKGFGFIAPEDGGKDVFVHFSALPGGIEALNVGDRVEFNEGMGRSGKPCAIDVKVIS
jgi:cold shock protein